MLGILRGIKDVVTNPWLMLGIVAVAGASFYGGMRVQNAFFAAAEVTALKKHAADLQADLKGNEELIEELSHDARKYERTFRNVEDRSTGDSCSVFDDDSLRLFNDALGYPEVRPSGTKPVSGSGAAPTPG